MASGTTKVFLPYGTTKLEVEVPSRNLVAVLERKQATPVQDESRTIREAVRSPIASAPLRERLHPTDKVVIVVTDNTRACPDDRLLPPILAEVETTVPRHNITIVIALGLHPPLDRAALIKKLGRNVVDNYNVKNHDIEQTVHLGETSRGTPVEVFKDVAEADFLLSTGFIEPHFFAGFSGGRKSITPGVSSRRSIRHNHRFEMIEDGHSRAGILRGNALHEDLVESAKLAGLDFIVNVLLDKAGKITHVVAGNPWLAHEKGCDLAAEFAAVQIARKADITITTNGGAPLDLDLYQTCKGIDTASAVTNKGGAIIIASLCNEGMGPVDYHSLHAEAKSPQQVIDRIKREEPIGVQWQNQVLARCQLGQQVFLMSSLKPADVQSMMITPISSVAEGLQKAMSALGPDAAIAVIPEGPYTLPHVG